MSDTNGSYGILERMKELTGSKSISTRALIIVMIESQQHIINRLDSDILANVQRDKDIKELKDKNIIIWAQTYPKTALFTAGAFMIVGSFVNWFVMGAGIIRGLVKQYIGIDIP